MELLHVMSQFGKNYGGRMVSPATATILFPLIYVKSKNDTSRKCVSLMESILTPLRETIFTNNSNYQLLLFNTNTRSKLIIY